MFEQGDSSNRCIKQTEDEKLLLPVTLMFFCHNVEKRFSEKKNSPPARSYVTVTGNVQRFQ